eukprot:TRINITY_DN1999_c0_g1_i4.p1 TRINITY_DN1999_c0_g1~~TRINITY_DN1999_c0_g1_i4.p1  ORF type:complete len:414 (+),score=49.79 TRINITY_DN1999_c0_g1_i4:190-1431(+)
MPGAVVGDVVGHVRNALTTCLAELVHVRGNECEICSSDIVLRREHFQCGRQAPSALRAWSIESPNVQWDDIGGLVQAKQELQDFCRFNLEYKSKMEQLGLKAARGVLLYGPPGCGKTMLGKALASQSKANFICVQGPELLNRWFGDSERAVREVFDVARSSAPCVLFFDEIDSIGCRQEGASGRVLTTLLCELDGISRHNRDLLIVGATNRPELLDPALLRPGRLDSLVRVGLPSHLERKLIISTLLSKRPCSSEVLLPENMELLAEKSEGCSGADLRCYVDEVCMQVLKDEVGSGQENLIVDLQYFDQVTIRKSVSQNDHQRYLEIEEQLKNGTLFDTQSDQISGNISSSGLKSTVKNLVDRFQTDNAKQLSQSLQQAQTTIEQQRKQITELQDKLGIISPQKTLDVILNLQ